jgi:hypothetical protein
MLEIEVPENLPFLLILTVTKLAKRSPRGPNCNFSKIEFSYLQEAFSMLRVGKETEEVDKSDSGSPLVSIWRLFACCFGVFSSVGLSMCRSDGLSIALFGLFRLSEWLSAMHCAINYV